MGINVNHVDDNGYCWVGTGKLGGIGGFREGGDGGSGVAGGGVRVSEVLGELMEVDVVFHLLIKAWMVDS